MALSAVLPGLCGGSASGKTTVANKIIEALDVPWVVLLSMDSFYKVNSRLSTIEGDYRLQMTCQHLTRKCTQNKTRSGLQGVCRNLLLLPVYSVLSVSHFGRKHILPGVRSGTQSNTNPCDKSHSVIHYISFLIRELWMRQVGAGAQPQSEPVPRVPLAPSFALFWPAINPHFTL